MQLPIASQKHSPLTHLTHAAGHWTPYGQHMADMAHAGHHVLTAGHGAHSTVNDTPNVIGVPEQDPNRPSVVPVDTRFPYTY